MKTANEILADFHIEADDAARMACVIEAHAQELDDCLTLIGDLDAARGAASPDRTAYLAGVYDHK